MRRPSYDPPTAKRVPAGFLEADAATVFGRLHALERHGFAVDGGLKRGQALKREVRPQAFGFHPRATDTDELHIGMARLERLHQSGAENVAGRFTGYQRNLQRRAHISG